MATHNAGILNQQLLEDFRSGAIAARLGEGAGHFLRSRLECSRSMDCRDQTRRGELLWRLPHPGARLFDSAGDLELIASKRHEGQRIPRARERCEMPIPP